MMKIKYIESFSGETIGISKPPEYNQQYMRFSPSVWWKLENDSGCERFIFLKDCKELEEAYQKYLVDGGKSKARWGMGEINEELRGFIRDVTLVLQSNAHHNPKKIEPLFQRAYKLYVKYDVEQSKVIPIERANNKISN